MVKKIENGASTEMLALINEMRERLIPLTRELDLSIGRFVTACVALGFMVGAKSGMSEATLMTVARAAYSTQIPTTNGKRIEGVQ